MEKINKLKKILKEEEIDGYIIPKNDEFFGEYTPEYNDRLNFISGFTGSYGFALVLRNKNYLFVDGRYTLQANNQSGRLFKIITIPNKMPNDILKGKKLLIGFDPNLFTDKSLSIFFGKDKFKLKPISKNLIDKIWRRKIAKNNNKFYLLPNRAVSEKYYFKINKICKYLKKKKSDYLFVTASENSAWLLNIRGRDTRYAPIPHSYVLIDKKKNIKFFCDLKKISSSFRRIFKRIEFLDIKDCTKTLLGIDKKKFIIDINSCSYFFKNIIDRNNKILNLQDPIYIFKAIKGKQEIENIKKVHIYDGIALTKYLFWLKKNFFKKKITEITASNKLLKFRKKNKKFKFLSFPTISGTGPNGAIIHYKATRQTDRKLKKGDIYLVDSGGQYEFGTTDVTRTISLKNSNKRIKDIFTRVLKGHIAVSNFKLKKNTTGSEIDAKARKYLKQIGLNFAHGTGHGVGYFLNVHEGPHAISKRNKVYFQKGMIVSNEPGYYEKNNFGIRIENLIYVKENKNSMNFENLTMAPIEKDLIIPESLNKNEKEWINKYHKTVFKNLKSSMNKIETLELKKACSAI
ncbi:aminopeptidase P family protein [Candidatus Pelagibacter bacterium]|nr:aminopeptidase P family protein [Candidatus Pelagibacter bacterium]